MSYTYRQSKVRKKNAKLLLFTVLPTPYSRLAFLRIKYKFYFNVDNVNLNVEFIGVLYPYLKIVVMMTVSAVHVIH